MSIWSCNRCYPFVLCEKHGWNCETEEWWYFPSLFWNSNFFFLIFTGSNCGDILLVYCDCGMDGWNCEIVEGWYSLGVCTLMDCLLIKLNDSFRKKKKMLYGFPLKFM